MSPAGPIEVLPHSTPMAAPPGMAANEPHVFVVLGATGDLMGRKLLPAIHKLFVRQLLNKKTVLFGADVNPNYNDESFRKHCVEQLVAAQIPLQEISRGIEKRVFYQPLPKDVYKRQPAAGSRGGARKRDCSPLRPGRDAWPDGSAVTG